MREWKSQEIDSVVSAWVPSMRERYRSTIPRREAAAAKAAVASAKAGASPVTEFEGEWQMVSAVMYGTAMEWSAVEWVNRITRGSETTVYTGPQVMMKMEFTSDPSKAPKTID